jgi:hypothetical protein
MKKNITILILSLTLLSLCAAAGYYYQRPNEVAYVLIKPNPGKQSYGVYVFLSPTTNGYDVKGSVYIGGSWFGMSRDLGVLGHVSKKDEAYRQWGQIHYDSENLYIGNKNDGYSIPLKTVYAHR